MEFGIETNPRILRIRTLRDFGKFSQGDHIRSDRHKGHRRNANRYAFDLSTEVI